MFLLSISLCPDLDFWCSPHSIGICGVWGLPSGLPTFQVWPLYHSHATRLSYSLILFLCTLKGEPDLPLWTLALPNHLLPRTSLLVVPLVLRGCHLSFFFSFYRLLLCGLPSKLWFLKCENPAVEILRSSSSISWNGELSRLSMASP